MKKHLKGFLIGTIAAVLALTALDCTAKRRVFFSAQKVPAGIPVAVVIDAPNSVKNAVTTRFMRQGFKVMAVNFADIHDMKDVYDIRDFKKVSYQASENSRNESPFATEKALENVFKLHFYNYEINKVQSLREIREKAGARYLVLLNLAQWEEVSWGRAIDLNSLELVWVDNYPTGFNDNVESIVDHFIASMTQGK